MDYCAIRMKDLWIHGTAWMNHTDMLLSKRVKSLSRVRLFATLWTVTYRAPPSVGFSRQEYWSGLPFPSPGDLPDSGINPPAPSFTSPALTGVFFTISTTWETPVFPGGSDGKNLSAMQETQVWSLDWDDSLKKEMVTHSSILTWKIPWTEEPCGLQSMRLQRVWHNWAINTSTNLYAGQEATVRTGHGTTDWFQ